MNGKTKQGAALMLMGLTAGLVLAVVLSSPESRTALAERGKALFERT